MGSGNNLLCFWALSYRDCKARCRRFHCCRRRRTAGCIAVARCSGIAAVVDDNADDVGCSWWMCFLGNGKPGDLAMILMVSPISNTN